MDLAHLTRNQGGLVTKLASSYAPKSRSRPYLQPGCAFLPANGRRCYLCCLRTDAEARLSHLAERRGHIGKVAEQAARIARIDDLLDHETLGCAEGRAKAIEPRLDLLELGFRILRRLR